MESWQAVLDDAPLEWLLEPDNPPVRARALTDLLGMDEDDADVVAAKEAIAAYPDVVRILANQESDGHWGRPDSYFHKDTGTAWRWLLLHELGLDPMHPQMQKTARFLLDIATVESGGFKSHIRGDPVPCYNGWLLWGFLRTGFGDDPRVQAGLGWVATDMRFADGDGDVENPDDGCWGRHTCYRGVVPLVKALATMPAASRSPGVDQTLHEGVDFMLRHRVYKRSHDPSKPLNAKLTQLTFPAFYWPDLVEVMLILTSMGVRDQRMDDSIVCLRKKQAKDGTWKLQRTYNERSKHDTFQVVVPLEERLAPSKWVTLRALTVLKRWMT